MRLDMRSCGSLLWEALTVLVVALLAAAIVGVLRP